MILFEGGRHEQKAKQAGRLVRGRRHPAAQRRAVLCERQFPRYRDLLYEVLPNRPLYIA